ncbi:hypothetical protein [Sanguibacter suaedae]|nr:hypothetical protein [Sanguibacter suaedae]
MRSSPPRSARATTAAWVATSTHSIDGPPPPATSPTAARTAARTELSSL